MAHAGSLDAMSVELPQIVGTCPLRVALFSFVMPVVSNCMAGKLVNEELAKFCKATSPIDGESVSNAVVRISSLVQNDVRSEYLKPRGEVNICYCDFEYIAPLGSVQEECA